MERLVSRWEKQAWFNLAVVLLACAAFVALIPVLGPKRAAGAFGLLGLLGISPLFALGRRGESEVIGDERDRMIQSQATLVAFAAFWLAFVAACMIPWFIYQQQGSVPVGILPLIVLVGWIVFTSTQSVATLVQYRRGRDVR
jgi:succinate-acetate transporter protein